MSENSLKKLLEQNARVVEEIKSGKKVILASEIEIQPKWDKVIDLDESGMVVDTPSSQWPNEIKLIIEEDL
ncbi:MAG: hypothetical protein E3J72_03315 [Planctomycetota bacterium]|nr:MAG: hypothetical protein E3J72_03315 [Planctomycetota bacterium]